MHTPTQEQWATVIEKLYSVLPFSLQENAGLAMLEVRVNKGHRCGTWHCVGGWYAVANWKEDALEDRISLGYSMGADAMAVDLGFKWMSELMDWAGANADIWGNYRGYDMFVNPSAYSHAGVGSAKNLADVIRHLEFVADNCKKLKA